jgi:hypothetical protein
MSLPTVSPILSHEDSPGESLHSNAPYEADRSATLTGTQPRRRASSRMTSLAFSAIM